MYHLVKTKTGKFQVVLVGKNGEPLSTSELLNTKQAAKRNIFAQLDAVEENHYQDDTVKSPRVNCYRVGEQLDVYKQDGNFLTAPVYIPGRNPKKKK